MSAFGGPNIIDDGLVLYLDAGNRKSYPGSGTTWFDKSGRGNNGTLTNGPTFDTGSLGSVVFDGVDDYIQLVNSTSYKVQFPITLCAWFNVQTLTNYGIILRNDNTSINHWGFAIYLNSDYTLGANYGNGINNGPQGRRSYASPIPISTDQWNYFVAVFPDNLSFNGYFNSLLINMPYVGGSATTAVYGTGGGTVGYRSDGPGLSYFKGNISSVQIYNRALTPQEVLQNYNATKGRFNL
jgi:hypothetical protein